MPSIEQRYADWLIAGAEKTEQRAALIDKAAAMPGMGETRSATLRQSAEGIRSIAQRKRAIAKQLLSGEAKLTVPEHCERLMEATSDQSDDPELSARLEVAMENDASCAEFERDITEGRLA